MCSGNRADFDCTEISRQVLALLADLLTNIRECGAECHQPVSDLLAQKTGEMPSVAERAAVEESATPSLGPYRNSLSTLSTPAFAVPVSRNEKIVISGNGITASLALAEPVVHLPQFDPAYPATARSVMLSGNLRLRLTKAIKIKKVELMFKGTAQTKMSNG